MTPGQLKTFIAVAECSSFSLAAQRLHLTQPAVSKRIRQLEEHLNTPLLVRLGGQVRTTDAGERLLSRARRLLIEVEDIETELRNLAGTVSGRLSLATSHHIGLHRLPALLRRFNQEHSAVRLDIHFVDSEEAHQLLIQGDAEVAVVTLNPLGDEKLTRVALWEDPLRFMGAPDHPLADSPTTLPELAKLPAVLPDMGTFTGQIVAGAFRDANLELQPSLATNYLETVRMLAAVGLGWTALPATMQDHSLVELDVRPDPQLLRRLGYMTNPTRPLSNAAQAFIDLLRDEVDARGR